MATAGAPVAHAPVPSQSQSGVNYTIAYDDSGASPSPSASPSRAHLSWFPVLILKTPLFVARAARG